MSYKKSVMYENNKGQQLIITRIDETNSVGIQYYDGHIVSNIEIPYQQFINMIIDTGLERA